MVRKCNNRDFKDILNIINDAARAYKGVIPAGCWRDPYMNKDELRKEIEAGIVFWAYEEDRELLGVMGIKMRLL